MNTQACLASVWKSGLAAPLPAIAIALLGLLQSAAGQSLRVSTSGGAPGKPVTIEVAFDPKSGQETVALQWELEVASNHLELDTKQPGQVTTAAQAAGKSLNCARATAADQHGPVRCILIGGDQGVPAGKVAVFTAQVPATAQPGTARIRFDHILALTRDLKQIPLKAVETTVKITPR